MKMNTFKLFGAAIFSLGLLYSNILMADDSNQITAIPNKNNVVTTSMPKALPLSIKQSTKLKKLFKSSSSNYDMSPETPHDHVIWKQTPIGVVFPLATKRMITFPISVQFGYDRSVLTDEMLKVQNNNGVLYLVAKKEFSVQRVQVKLNDNSKIILLNLSAKKVASNTPLDVVV